MYVLWLAKSLGPEGWIAHFTYFDVQELWLSAS